MTGSHAWERWPRRAVVHPGLRPEPGPSGRGRGPSCPLSRAWSRGWGWGSIPASVPSVVLGAGVHPGLCPECGPGIGGVHPGLRPEPGPSGQGRGPSWPPSRAWPRGVHPGLCPNRGPGRWGVHPGLSPAPQASSGLCALPSLRRMPSRESGWSSGGATCFGQYRWPRSTARRPSGTWQVSPAPAPAAPSTHSGVARPRAGGGAGGRRLHATGGPHKEGLWCHLAGGWKAWCGDPLQVPPDPQHYP